MNTIRSREKLTRELQDKEIRDFFVAEHINIGIPFQVRALREQRGLTQKELAQRAGMKQERISAIENPNYKNAFTLSTLVRLASAFDVALIVRFEPISELVKWELNLSSEALEAVSFDEDPYFNRPAQEEGSIASLGSASLPQISNQGLGDVIPTHESLLPQPLRPGRSILYIVKQESQEIAAGFQKKERPLQEAMMGAR